MNFLLKAGNYFSIRNALSNSLKATSFTDKYHCESLSTEVPKITKQVVVNNAKKSKLVITEVKPLNPFFKTPVNRAKAFSPTTVNVGRGNKHLLINLFDEIDNDLGKISLEAANELAKKKELKLVIIDDVCSPVKFKLMNGNNLYKMQREYRETNKDFVKETKEKEVRFKLGIDENDFAIKKKMIHQFYEKGHLVKIIIKSQIARKFVRNGSIFLYRDIQFNVSYQLF